MRDSQTEEIADLRESMLSILMHSQSIWGKIEEEQKEQELIKKKNELLNYYFLEYNDGALKSAMNDMHFRGRRKYRIFLPPLNDERGFLPLLTFEWNFSGTNNDYRFFLDLVDLDPANGCPKILSLRYEIHGGGRDHNYPHMQINNRMDINGGVYELHWLPKHHPHVLLRSDKYQNSPFVLLIYLLQSLYGFKEPTLDALKNIPKCYLSDMNDYFSL
jgi:hypothetical protein